MPIHRRGVRESAGLCLGKRDEFARVLRGHVRMSNQHEWKLADLDDRREVLERPVADREKVRRGRHRRGRRRKQRVSVRSALGHEFVRDGSGGARPAVNHHLLAEYLGELLRERPGEDVDRGSTRETVHETNGLARIGLRETRNRSVRQPHAAGNQLRRQPLV